MENKELILRLIQQDLKHNQLTHGLFQIGLENNGTHDLDILSIVAQLMQVPQGKFEDRWCDLYFSYMNEASKTEIANNTENLLPMAQDCYNMLQNYIEIENRIYSNP